jgi:hypothetical protein
MKTAHVLILFSRISKSIAAAVKSVFESPDKKEFKRLRDFIAS